MQHYTDNVQDRRGNALKGASITVTTLAGALATLYSDNGVTIQANPIITGRDGEYSFYAANGRYNLAIAAPGFASDVVLDFSLADPLETVAQAAVAGAAAAQAVKTAIDNRNRGALAADPATRTDGTANQVGDAYFYVGGSPNLTKTFNGATWQASDINTANLAASGGALLVGANANQTQDAINLERVSCKRYGAVGNGIANDGAALRSMIAVVPAGSTIFITPGTYLVDQDGANPYCLNISKRLHIVFAPGVIFKCSAAGVRAVFRVSSAFTHTGSPVVDGDYKTNHAVEVVAGAKGTTFRKWTGRNVTQQYNAVFSASPFSVVSEVGIIFDDCDATNAVSYPNAVIGDAAGTARGFHFYGAAPAYGINAVVNSRVDNIRNTNGLAGLYEDEDGIVSQMSGSFTLIDNNTLTNCMKRGIKLENSALVRSNQIISSRSGADNAIDGAARMYAGISIYGSDISTDRNTIGSDSEMGGAAAGSFFYGIEAGVSASRYNRITLAGDTLKLGATSNARSIEFIRLWGALVDFNMNGVTAAVATGPTINQTYGVRTDFDHATDLASVQAAGNTFRNMTNAMHLRGGFTGKIGGTRMHAMAGPGILVEASASPLRPTGVTFDGNKGLGFNNYAVRITDPGAVDMVGIGNTSDAAGFTAFSVAAGIRHVESGSNGLSRPSVMYVAAPPTTGTYKRGDCCVNSDPRDASPVVEWRCQYAGTPGNWRAAHWMTMKGATVSRPTLTVNDAGVQYLDTSLAAAGKPITWTGTAWVDSLGVAA